MITAENMPILFIITIKYSDKTSYRYKL